MAPTAGTRLRMKKAQARKPHHHAQAKKVPSLKNRIRGLERFLKRGGIPDATRRAKQAELTQLQEEHKAKEQVEEEKKNAEKYKRPRFFERIKVMRKLRRAKTQLENATSKADKKQSAAEFERLREDMMYIFFFPRGQPYLSLFSSKPLSDDELLRQQELRQEAIARFEREQPVDAFHHFCFNDDKDATGGASAPSAADLLLKKPSKEEAKKHKKPRKKHEKDASAVAAPVLADLDGDDAGDDQDGDNDDGEEEDDFFL